ncbi:transmembrane protein 256 [Solea senegalensis]|uniref:Transmembrane protein 256 n=1 Tax=Solea senegalensis TaxID=28829 RepID=A0AAV6QRZ6_SOLSE|nr:transmembrane protein 256 [Solea senegalensis]
MLATVNSKQSQEGLMSTLTSPDSIPKDAHLIFATLLRHVNCYKGFKNTDPDDYQIMIFETANKYHFYHSLALLGAAHCGKPALAGTLLIAGMGMFCGSLYHQAMTKDPALRKVAPIGGMALIAGWVAMVL